MSADVGASAAVDLPAGTVDAGVGGAVAAGDVATVDTSVAAAADIPAGAVDVAAGASVAAVGVRRSMSVLAAAVDVPAGTVDVGLDTSVASTDVGAAVGVDAGAGNVSADVGVGPVNVGLDVGTGGVGLDLGLGTEDDSGSSGGCSAACSVAASVSDHSDRPRASLAYRRTDDSRADPAAARSGQLAPLEHSVADARSRLLQREVHSDIVLVGIDARSLADLRQWPWPRRYHARLLETHCGRTAPPRVRRRRLQRAHQRRGR